MSNYIFICKPEQVKDKALLSRWTLTPYMQSNIVTYTYLHVHISLLTNVLSKTIKNGLSLCRLTHFSTLTSERLFFFMLSFTQCAAMSADYIVEGLKTKMQLSFSPYKKNNLFKVQGLSEFVRGFFLFNTLEVMFWLFSSYGE